MNMKAIPGCKFYKKFYKEKVMYCPGEVCEVRSKPDIQKTSWTQILIVFGFIAYIFPGVILFNDDFNKKPSYLFGNE